MTLVQSEPKAIKIGIPHDDYSAMQGPAPNGFHVPLNTEWQSVYDIWTALGGGSSGGTNFGMVLKLPFAGFRNCGNSNVYNQGSYGCYWSSTRYNEDDAYSLYFDSSSIYPQNNYYRSNAFSVRPFKDAPVTPTSSWIKLYGTSIEDGGIFWSSTDGLISLSSDGSNWITIADKNLGATAVWNSGDTLSQSNCGYYYQRGNNYGFPRTGTLTDTSTTRVNASNYGPGNYYSSSTFIKYNGDWDNSNNRNLWGGVTGVIQIPDTEVKAVYLGTTKVRPSGWKPGANTVAYFPFETDILDHSGNSVTLSTSGFTYTQQTVGYLFSGNGGVEFNDSSVKFINVWMNIQTKGTPFGNGAYMGGGGLCYSAWHSESQINGAFLKYINASYSRAVSNKTNLSSGWHNFAIGYDSTTTKCYLDGELFWTSSGLPYSFSSIAGLFSCWGDSNNSSAILSQGIFEATPRTAEEISDYYNLTKSNYGL